MASQTRKYKILGRKGEELSDISPAVSLNMAPPSMAIIAVLRIEFM
jgi:hypothetical protein